MRPSLQSHEVGRNDLETIDEMAFEVLSHGGRVSHPFLSEYVEAPTATQGGKDHGVAQICSNARHRCKGEALVNARRFRIPCK